MAARLTWHGKAVVARVLAASLEAIDDVTEQAAQDAQQNHWWRSRRGQAGLEGEIVVEPASLVDGRPTGRFGTGLRRDGFYGLFLEQREPFLRPAADRAFPTLAKRIRKRLR